MKEGTTWTDQELDALFQDAAARENIPPFQDEFWDEMEAMLPAKKKRIGFIWWGAASLLIVSLGVTGALLLTDSNSKTQNQLASKHAPPPKTDESHQNVQSTDVVETVPVNNAMDVQPLKTVRYAGIQASFVQSAAPQSGFDTGKSTCGGLSPKDEVSNIDNAVLGTKRPLFTSTRTLNSVGGSKYNTGIPLYAEVALGFGQSYRRAEYSSNWMPQIRIGAGLYSEIGGMELNAGLAFRAELPDNITYEMINSYSPGVDSKTTVDIKRLYSLEFPLYMGGKFGRNSIGGVMIPGIQMRFSGVRTVYENSQVKSRDEISGRTFESKTMTMEMGIRYCYSLNENIQLTSSFTMDVVRPFQSEEYLGDVKQYPATFFVGLRRTF